MCTSTHREQNWGLVSLNGEEEVGFGEAAQSVVKTCAILSVVRRQNMGLLICHFADPPTEQEDKHHGRNWSSRVQ